MWPFIRLAPSTTAEKVSHWNAERRQATIERLSQALQGTSQSEIPPKFHTLRGTAAAPTYSIRLRGLMMSDSVLHCQMHRESPAW